jgi:hypothetical protein
MSKSASPSAFAILPRHLEELQKAAENLKLNVNAAVLVAGDSLVEALAAGWRPKQLPKASPDHLLVLRINPKTKTIFQKSAKSAEIGFSDFGRVAALGALRMMAGKDQVLWPLQLKAKDFEKALSVYAR